MAAKPPPRFAEGTTVDVGKTQGEIRTVLARHGATAIGVSEDVDQGAMLLFKLRGRTVRLAFALPRPSDDAFRYDGRGLYRAEGARRAACDAELRRRWRALLMRLKSRLEEIAAGEASVDEVFLAYLVLPDGRTIGQEMSLRLGPSSQLGPGGSAR
jgi:hypothetical protein